MKRLAGLADGVVVWGGDGAVRGVRELAGPSVKLIEWGHKISFAYVTLKGVRGQDGGRQLRLLARNWKNFLNTFWKFWKRRPFSVRPLTLARGPGTLCGCSAAAWKRPPTGESMYFPARVPA